MTKETGSRSTRQRDFALRGNNVGLLKVGLVSIGTVTRTGAVGWIGPTLVVMRHHYQPSGYSAAEYFWYQVWRILVAVRRAPDDRDSLVEELMSGRVLTAWLLAAR